MLQALNLTMTIAPVKVVVRIKPQEADVKIGSSNCLSICSHSSGITASFSKETSSISISDHITDKKVEEFHFDSVYGSEASTAEIYNETAKPLIENSLKGYNVTLFAYGQSHSGKTYTMFGNETTPGITDMAIDDIFSHIGKEKHRFFIVRIALLEIHKERLIDLSAPRVQNAENAAGNATATRLRVRETSSGFLFIENLVEEICGDAESAHQVLSKNLAGRRNGHVICRLVIESRQFRGESEADNLTRVSEVNFVVLGGSEGTFRRASLQPRLSEVEREENSINKSLLMLGLVIQQLSQGVQTVVNFRNSILTRLLQNSLAGNAYTAVICTVSQKAYDMKQTLNTLKFASMAKMIKTKPQVNGLFPIEHAVLPRLQIRKPSKDLSASNAAAADSDFVRQKLFNEICSEADSLCSSEEHSTGSRANSLIPNDASHGRKASYTKRLSWATTDQGRAMVTLLPPHASIDGGSTKPEPIERSKTEIIFDKLLVAGDEELDGDDSIPDEMRDASAKLRFIVGGSVESITALHFDEPEQFRDSYVPRRSFDALNERMRAMKRALIAHFPPGHPIVHEIREDEEFESILEKLCIALTSQAIK